MRRLAATLSCLIALGGCAARRPQPGPSAAPAAWAERLRELERAEAWQLDGRAAAALGQQGWQASLDWVQRGSASEVRLAGPLGVGATEIQMTPAGVSLNGAPPSEAVLAQLQQKLGFDLPLGNLRYWLLGIPDPGTAFELTRNPQDRAARLSQAGWTIDYGDYMSAKGDLLPKHLVLSRADARVKIAVDRWPVPP